MSSSTTVTVNQFIGCGRQRFPKHPGPDWSSDPGDPRLIRSAVQPVRVEGQLLVRRRSISRRISASDGTSRL